MIGKKAGEKILSLWWIFILTLIGGFIIFATAIFYSAEINTNSIESAIILDKLADCFIYNGYLNENVLNDSFDIFYSCGIDSKVFFADSLYYFNVSIIGENLTKEFIFGKSSFESDCRVSQKISGKYLPSCSTENYFAFYNNSILKIKIMSGVNQQGSKV